MEVMRFKFGVERNEDKYESRNVWRRKKCPSIASRMRTTNYIFNHFHYQHLSTTYSNTTS